MNRRQLLKLGALAVVAPKAVATIRHELPIGDPRFYAGMDVGFGLSRSVLTVVAVHHITGTVTLEWSGDDGVWRADDYAFTTSAPPSSEP